MRAARSAPNTQPAAGCAQWHDASNEQQRKTSNEQRKTSNEQQRKTSKRAASGGAAHASHDSEAGDNAGRPGVAPIGGARACGEPHLKPGAPGAKGGASSPRARGSSMDPLLRSLRGAGRGGNRSYRGPAARKSAPQRHRAGWVRELGRGVHTCCWSSASRWATPLGTGPPCRRAARRPGRPTWRRPGEGRQELLGPSGEL